MAYVSGCARRYQAGETPMQDYVNVHGLLEQRRATAKATGKQNGPRTFVRALSQCSLIVCLKTNVPQQACDLPLQCAACQIILAGLLSHHTEWGWPF